MNWLMNLGAAPEWNAVAQTALKIGVILAICWMILYGIGVITSRMQKRLLSSGSSHGEAPWESQRRVETLMRLLRRTMTAFVLVTLIMAILMQMGVQIGPLLASAGIIGLAFSVGAQNLVRDIIAGFFMILENQVRVGDVVVANGTRGLVEEVNFRTLILRDDAGVVHVFPNGAITSLANTTRVWSAYVFELNVPYKDNVDHVLEIVQDTGKGLKEDRNYGPLMLGNPEIFGVDRLADTAVVIKGRIRTKPIRQWDVGREFLRRVKNAFDQAGL